MFSGVVGDLENGLIIMVMCGKGNCIVCYVVSVLDDYLFYGEVGFILDGVGDCWFEVELCGIVVNVKIMFFDLVMLLFYKMIGFICLGNVYIGKVGIELLLFLLMV